MKVSVVLASYNSFATINYCLNSLFRQTCHPDEIIVVDSSSDPTISFIERNYPSVKLIKRQERTYCGAARNIGVRAATGDIIAFTDTDCVVAHNWIEEIIRSHRQHDAIAIGGAIHNGNQHNWISWAEYFLAASEYFAKAPQRNLRTIAGCNATYKRIAFEKYGYLPEISAFEDVLFNIRLNKAGEKILFEPSIQVSHLYRTKLNALLQHEFRNVRAMKEAAQIEQFKEKVFLKHPLIPILWTPAKFLLITNRILRWNRTAIFRFLVATPYVLMGLLATTYGLMSKRCE
mgnify:CR=1 FL=1